MSHHTILGLPYLHDVNSPEQLPQCMCCVSAMQFGGRQLEISHFDSAPSHIHSPQHTPFFGTYQCGPNTINAGHGANGSSSFGACPGLSGEPKIMARI